MGKWKKILLGLAGILTAIAGGYGVNELGGSSNVALSEVQLFATSTNANYVGVPFINVNDYDVIGITILSDSSSGTVRVACSTQDSEPTQAATSTSNRWDYVDVVDTQSEASIDGWTGVVLAGGAQIRQLAIRNSMFKWCTVRQSGNTTPAGIGTTTAFIKRTVK